jgi:hypothetical protein
MAPSFLRGDNVQDVQIILKVMNIIDDGGVVGKRVKEGAL